jgi:hypothetical protein
MDMRGISRRKTDWLVRCVYKNKKPQFQRMFADDHFGGRDGALQEALNYKQTVLNQSNHDIGMRRRLRCETVGFIREPTLEDYSFVKNYTERLIRGRRFKAIYSDIVVEEVVQSALLAYCSISDGDLVDKSRYLQIQVGLALRGIILTFERRCKRVSHGLQGIEGGRSRFVKL